MNRIALVAPVVAAVACGGEAGGGSQAQVDQSVSDQSTACVFNTRLLPENEIRTPPVTDPVESTAQGHAQIKIRADATLEYKVSILNQAGETIIAGHVHEAPAGSNGDIVVPLFTGPPTSDEHFTQHAQTAIDATLAADICANPSQYYVNYHTTQDPQGAIRGQLE